MPDGEDLARQPDRDLLVPREKTRAESKAEKRLATPGHRVAGQYVPYVGSGDSARTGKAGRLMSRGSDDTARPFRAMRDRQLRDQEAEAEAARRLGQAIENDILPALLKFHGGSAAFEENVAELAELEADAVDYFISVLLRQDYAATVGYLDDLRRRPVPLSVLFSDLLTPAAQRLGEMWADDECSFVDVTIGVSHLQRLVRDFAPLYAADVVPSAGTGRMLLAATSGEQHTFALALLGEMFRRSGWVVYEAPEHSGDELTELLSLQQFDVVGLSLSYDGLADALERDIQLIRAATTDAPTRIIVGGPAFTVEPGLPVGALADAVLLNAEAALEFANAVVQENRKFVS